MHKLLNLTIVWACGQGSIAIEAWDRQKGERHPELVALRDAVRSFSENAAQDLDLDSLERWVPHQLRPDLSDPEQVKALGKLYALFDVPGQGYKLSYRSTVAGGPLIPVDDNEYIRFPDEDAIFRAISWSFDARSVYIAVTRPKWRIAWTIDTQQWLRAVGRRVE